VSRVCLHLCKINNNCVYVCICVCVCMCVCVCVCVCELVFVCVLGLIKQFLTNVFWGNLDFLIIDGIPLTYTHMHTHNCVDVIIVSLNILIIVMMCVSAPPGTSDEHISIAQYLRGTTVEGAIIVTTPQVIFIDYFYFYLCFWLCVCVCTFQYRVE